MNNLSVEIIENAAGMPQELRARLYRALKWHFLAGRIMQLVEYQARQKRKKSNGAVPTFCLHIKISARFAIMFTLASSI